MLDPDNRLRDLLIKHEGLRLKPYRDTKGILTIGVGRNLDDVGISEIEAMALLSNDIARANLDALKFPWFNSLNTTRQDVVVSMLFNMGLATFSEFKQMQSALAAGNFDGAADEMLDSDWHTQEKERTEELASMMRTGKYPV